MKKSVFLIVLLVLFVCAGCSQKINNGRNDLSQEQTYAQNINNSESDKIDSENAKQNSSEILDALADKRCPMIGGDMEEAKEEIVTFAQDFINLFTGSIGACKEVSFENYITNENLLKFCEKMVELEIIKDLNGGNAVNYSLENEFNDMDFKVFNDNLCFLKITFSNQGSGMVSQMLVKKEDDKISIVDVYFGNKDGVDTLITGHHTERKLDNSDLWHDEIWVQSVFEKLEKHEKELVKIQKNNGGN